MKILAIDTSSKICSVCILENDKIILEKHNDDEKTHSQKLMPLVDEILKNCNLELKDIDLFSCCVGPGSFTGLRIGISTVKAFADSLDKPVSGVSSLEGLAYNINQESTIASLIDAKNENVYLGIYSYKENVYTRLEDERATTINDAISSLEKYKDNNLIIVGDCACIYQDLIKEKLTNASFADESQNIQTSSSIGRCSYKKYQEGLYGNSNTLIPLYLRKSQAERALDGEK